MRCITFVCLIAALSASAAFAEISSERVAVPAHSVPEARLFYDAPAQVWTEALPLGNGRLGAMVYGGVAKELVPINEDTIWSGGPGANITGGLSPETAMRKPTREHSRSTTRSRASRMCAEASRMCARRSQASRTTLWSCA